MIESIYKKVKLVYFPDSLIEIKIITPNIVLPSIQTHLTYLQPMIKRTKLPNLVSKSNNKTSLSNNPRPSHHYNSIQSEANQSPPHHFNNIQSDYKHNFSSLNHIQHKHKIQKLKTDQSLHSQASTLQIKNINPELFHTQLNKYKQPYPEPYTNDSISQDQTKRIAPYFFKIQASLKILQNQDQLKRKMLLTQIEQTNKLKNQTTNNSKKRIQKKLTNSSQKKPQPSIQNTQKNTPRLSTITSTKKAQSNKKFYTQISQTQNTQSLLEDRKRQLTTKAKEGLYTFEHFNSGEIFDSIAELNAIKILANPDHHQYKTTNYGTYANNVNGTKPMPNKNVQNRIYEQFKQQYNSFLKKKLPPSFGQNGNKSCIYEEYVQKRRLQQIQSITSKVITRSQPKKSHKAESIFSNQIKAICQRKVQAQKMYNSAVRSQEEQVIKKTTVTFLKQSSTQTSRMISEINSKLNTLRHGQSLQDKLKLKKLAKLDFMQKSKKMKKKVLKSITQNKQKQALSKRKSSLSGYSSNENKISEEEMQKLKEKSELILGKEFELSNPVINPEYDHNKCSKMMKNAEEKFTQLNQFETKHLQHIDLLLKKQVSILRKEKQDLESTPWKIPIKINKKPSIN